MIQFGPVCHDKVKLSSTKIKNFLIRKKTRALSKPSDPYMLYVNQSNEFWTAPGYSVSYSYFIHFVFETLGEYQIRFIQILAITSSFFVNNSGGSVRLSLVFD